MSDAEPVVERPAERVREGEEFRRTHFRAYDEDGFVKAFPLAPPSSATLAGVTAYLCEKFHGKGGTGFDSKDLVVLLGPRIVAVVRQGKDGQAQVVTFED
jgi:hypothetical protein